MQDENYHQICFVQRHECERRARFVSDVSYDLKLNLPRGEYFSGCV
jgi:aminopeptidase N